MATTKYKWRVGDRPTGRYRSFEQREWPHAEADVPGDEVWVAKIRAAVGYEPRLAETTALTVDVADRSRPGQFKWRTLKTRPVGLTAAKALVARFFSEVRPEWLPGGAEK